MAITKVTDTFNELTNYHLNDTSMLRMFNILDDDGTKFLNIFRSYTVNDDVKNNIVFYDTYEVSNSDFWENVSYNLYKTVVLWWAVCLLNDVINPFEELEDGKNIKILKYNYIPYLLTEIKNMAAL